MKHFLLILFLLGTTTLFSQKLVSKNSNGDYVEVPKVFTVESLTKGCEKTSASYVDKDHNRFPVYMNQKTKKIFYLKTSKSGKLYRVYIKEQ